jgi:hypothetical protein
VVYGFRFQNPARYETGWGSRGKWRIPDENVSDWYVFMFGALKVVAPAYIDRLSYLCMVSIGCKLVYVNQLNLANNLLKRD